MASYNLRTEMNMNTIGAGFLWGVGFTLAVIIVTLVFHHTLHIGICG